MRTLRFHGALTYIPALLLLWVGNFLIFGSVSAQESPDRRYLFTSNSKDDKKRREESRKSILSAPAASQDFNVQAPVVEYDKNGAVLKGKGGLLISQGTIKAQATEGTVNLETKDTDLQKGVYVSMTEGTFDAESAKLNIDTETGEFSNTDVNFEASSYLVHSEKVLKLSEFEYELSGSEFSACHCSEGEKPWSFSSGRCNITQEGYGHSYNNWLKLDGTKILYLPYLGFPAKTERASGLLAPNWGFSGSDGFMLHQPVFVNLSDSADLTLTPFTYTRTRSGLSLGGRKKFSRDNDLNFRFLYSDESARFPYDPQNGLGLRGINPALYSDPNIDRNRFGYFVRQRWSSDPDWLMPSSMYTDLHYVSDDLMPRELVDDEMVPFQSRYAVSTMALQSVVGGSTTVGVSGEYNQALAQDSDELTFQRIPQFTVNNFESFRPFGFNPLGLKLVSKSVVRSELFRRDTGYDGWRTDINPAFSVPFHVKNYMNGALNFGAHETYYNQDSTTLTPLPPSVGVEDYIEENSQRRLYNLGFNLGTGVERVYELDQDSWLKDVTGWGTAQRGTDLLRVKHTMDPYVAWDLVPYASQSHQPFYDGFDHVRRHSVFSVGMNSSLWGRFLPRENSRDELLELSPELGQLPVMDQGRPLQTPGVFNTSMDPTAPVALRGGEIRQLAVFQALQSYDYFAQVDDRPDQDPWSSTYFRLLLSPSAYFAIGYDTNFNFERSNVDSWNTATSFKDDRGDVLRLRYTYVDNPLLADTQRLSQIEGNLETVLTDRVRLGYYQRFDENTRDTLERGAALRLFSGCRCWNVDLGIRDRKNPDKRVFLLTFTFAGLGDITQPLYTQRDSVAN